MRACGRHLDAGWRGGAAMVRARGAASCHSRRLPNACQVLSHHHTYYVTSSYILCHIIIITQGDCQMHVRYVFSY